MSEKIIIQYLENISGQMDKISTEIRDIKQDVRVLDEKVEKLTARIDEVEETLNRRILTFSGCHTQPVFSVSSKSDGR